ncbi:MAG: sigma-70 family RNA polymerase sigma factor, partial [Alphaproteobacteria bacterium]|nr:sigma-70 family RNA polymerase sigma factor [Alphaproteobacteria bacterium]
QRDIMLAELYHELRSAAARLLRREAPDLTLQPTELVNEASLRLMQIDRMTWIDHQHFYATGARILRQAMTDAIRKRKRMKRQVPDALLDCVVLNENVDVIALDAALVKLEKADPQLARLVEMRYFVGLSIDEVALISNVSPATIKRRWQTARAWLASELTL